MSIGRAGLILGIAIVLTNVFVADAIAKTKIDTSGFTNALANLHNELELVSKSKNAGAKVSYERESGLIKEIESLDNQNKDPQNTAAIIDYCLLQQPAKNTFGNGYYVKADNLTVSVSAPLVKAIGKSPAKASKVIYLRAIPAHILVKYPKLFSKDYIFSSQNLRVLPEKFASVEALKAFRKDWIDFFVTNNSPTKQDMLQILSAVDKKYSQDYVTVN